MTVTIDENNAKKIADILSEKLQNRKKKAGIQQSISVN